ncbi:hypothetical protein MPSEU_000831200 [Mayamaea pseudoterrestris]|nr:hypothetical protein MPSEU_000831200 [Mayamaea pseudoterrestris]
MEVSAAERQLDAQNQRFLDTVDRIVQRVNLQEGREGGTPLIKKANTSSEGPLTSTEMGELSFLCSLASTLPESTELVPTGFAAVELDQLSALTDLLDRHINLAAGINLFQQAHLVIVGEDSSGAVATALDKWIKHQGTRTIVTLRMGLEAASIVIYMASMQGVDRRATNEDAIEASISLMRSHLQKNIMPTLCQTGHLAISSGNAVSLEEKIKTDSSPAAKRRKISDHAAAVSPANIRPVYKLILPTINAQILLVERLENLVRLVPLDDQQIMMLTSPAMMVLEVDCVPMHSCKSVSPGISLQKAYIALATEAFRRYKLHRETILEDMFPIMLRLPTGRKARACHVSYLGVPSGASFAAFNASLLKGLVSTATQPHNIQMMTAMLLSLVQACVTRPTYVELDNNSEQQQEDVFLNGLQECKMVVDFFCTQLLGRCSKKKSVMEFRPILVNLVEDLLLCLLLPEYPAAELMVSGLLSRLTFDMKRSSSTLNSKSKQALETTYLNTAFDLVGKIGSVQARILAVYRDKALHMTTTEPVARDEHDELILGCYCGNTSSGGHLIIECDNCQISFHGSCVNIDHDMDEDEWFCDACKLSRLFERERCRHEHGGENSFVNEEYVLYQSFFSFLSHREGGALKELHDATQVHLARWTAVLNPPTQKTEKSVKPKRITRGLLEFWDVPGPGAEPLTDEGTNRLILSLAVKTSQIFKCFHPQISVILQLMGDGSHALRKLSLKALEKTAEGDPALMAMKHITEGVAQRFTDESISVREAAIALVGAYMISAPNIADSFHSSLLPCLSDSGVSVRKRAVKIFEGVLMSNASYKGRAQACHLLLQRAADPKEEDSVRDSIYDLFTHLWLRGGQDVVATVSVTRQRDVALVEMQSPSSTDVSDQANLITPNTPSTTSFGKKTVYLKRSDIAAEQMMKVVRSGGTNIHLASLLKTLIDGEDTEIVDRKKRASLGQKFRDELIDSLFELLMSVEEQRSARSSRVAKDIAATLQTIAVFTDFAPIAVLRQIDVLLLFLKADNGVCFEDETAIVSTICDILYRLVIVLQNQAANRLSSLKVAMDLRGVVCKFPPTTIEAAIRAWCAIIEHEDNKQSEFSIKFLELLRSFYRHLVLKNDQYNDFSKADQDTRDRVGRSLVVIGLICQYYGHRFAFVDWDDVMANAMSDFVLPPAKTLTWDEAAMACFSIFSTYLQKADSSTKCKALSGYSGMFLAAPRLLLKLEEMKLITALMDAGAEISLQRETLRCLQKILVSEELRIDGGTAKQKAKVEHSVTERISGDQDGDATIFGGILANHANRLCEMTQSGDVELRDASLKLLEVLLRQGLINPNDAVPYLFALQGDINNSSIRSRALRLLMTEADKRPDMIRQRVCAGVKKAYELQRIINPKKTDVSALIGKHHGRNTTYECVFDSLFKECIRSNRKQRLGLYANLLGQFELYKNSDFEGPQTSRKNTKSTRTDFPLLGFSSQVLAHLSYNTVTDPLFIIHSIGSIVGFQGPHVLDRLAALLRPVGLASEDELDETNASEDVLERAAKTKFPKNTKEAKAILANSFDMVAFAELCQAGAGLALLLRLKGYLRQLYNLSEARCLEYDPNAKERPNDKNISKNQTLPPFDAHLDASQKATSGDVDAVIRQYADFRVLMREETVSAQEAEFAASESENDEVGNDDAGEADVEMD